MEAEKVLEIWLKIRQRDGKYENNYTEKELCELMRMYYHMRTEAGIKQSFKDIKTG